MSHIYDDSNLRASKRLLVPIDTSARNYRIATPPYQQRRSFVSAQEMGQGGIVHVGLPSEPRRLRARVLERLELRRRHLAAIELGKFGRAGRIRNWRSQMCPDRDRKDVLDLTGRGLHTHR